MHIVMVGDYPRDPNHIGGGVEAVVLYLSQALQHYSDLKLDVITLERWGRERRTVNHGQVTVHYLPASTLPSRLSIMDNIRQMRDEMLRLKPDLVHVHISSEYAHAAAKTGLPWILTLHGIRYLESALRSGLLNRYRGWFIKRDEFQVIQKAKHIISISPFIQSVFNGHIRGKVYDIENPISEAFFKVPQKRTPGQLLYAGRLIPRKDIMTLLRAFADLRQRIPEARLRLAGGSTFKSEPNDYHLQLKNFVTEADLEESVTFLGNLDEPALLEEYANCAALVLSSILETAPMVIMQALAAGKPVVSTDAGGARYLVEDGKTGFIVPIGAQKALADAMFRVLHNETELETMSNRAKATAEQRFRATVVAERTRQVYYEVFGQVPPPA